MQSAFSTQRLSIDLITETDHAFTLSLVNSRGWLKFIGDRQVHSEEESVLYIKKILATPDLNYWVVRLAADGTPVGILSFMKRSYLEHYDIGFAFCLNTMAGVMPEAAKAVLSYAEGKSQYQPILATTLPDNARSIRLLNKLGFHFEREIEIQNDKLLVFSNSKG
ncbi:MAG: GNAT family N-acetyltransferase [Chitinophagaceae bacterium]|nr:GNAT family N-acetyltransferase [Chitinophagaceae bacterium]